MPLLAPSPIASDLNSPGLPELHGTGNTQQVERSWPGPCDIAGHLMKRDHFKGLASRRGSIVLSMCLYKKRNGTNRNMTLLLMESGSPFFRKSCYSASPHPQHCPRWAQERGVTMSPNLTQCCCVSKTGNFQASPPFSLHIQKLKSGSHQESMSTCQGCQSGFWVQGSLQNQDQQSQFIQSMPTTLTYYSDNGNHGTVRTTIKGYHKGRRGRREKMEPTT